MSCVRYAYPVPNSRLIAQLNLSPHPEGGYFVVTHTSAHSVPVSALSVVEGRDSEITISADRLATRLLGTAIYYLLSPSSPRGYLHMNKSTTMHFHHAGRARYTLIRPGNAHEGPSISYVTIGEDVEAGEVRQLLVEGGVWKCSEIPPEDMAGLEEDDLVPSEVATRGERVGCLISELVFPGFDWSDHAYLKLRDLQRLFVNSKTADEWKKFEAYLKPDDK